MSVPSIAGAAPGDFLGAFGPDGTESTEFEVPAALGLDQGSGVVYVADSEQQALYKFDQEGQALSWGGVAGYLTGNELTGLSLKTNNATDNQVAVDSESHVVYVTNGNSVAAFDANGEKHIFPVGPGEGTNEIPGAADLDGLTVDRFGNIYAADASDKLIRIYTQGGELIRSFTPIVSTFAARPNSLAVGPGGSLYAGVIGGSIYRFEPSQFPISSTTTYSAGVRVNEEFSMTVAVDPATNYVYIGEFLTGSVFRVAVFDEKNEFVGSIGGPAQPGELKGRAVGVGVSGLAKRAYVAVRAEGLDPPQVEMFQSFAFPVIPPTINETSVTDVTSTSGTLRGKINPNTLESTYWFEYGLENCEVAVVACVKVPSDGASAGSGHVPVPVSARLVGLHPNTKYFYRIVAENSEGKEEGPVRAFTTQQSLFGSPLIDDRAWEQVTPTEKFGGVVTNASFLQAELDGSGIAFQTRGSIVEDPESNRALEPSAVLAKRGGPGSWQVADLVPPHTEAGGLGFGPEFKLFSPGLDQALFEPRDDTQLSPETSERTPYLRTNASSPGYTPLVTSANVPAGTVFGGEANGERNPVSVTGANSSLDHVALIANAALVEESASRSVSPRSVYLWSNGEIEPVSELPIGEDGPAGKGGDVVEGLLGSGAMSVRNAVSNDGNRVFWAPGENHFVTFAHPGLYVRDMEADRSSRLDVVKSGGGSGEVEPAFMGANEEGTVVYFTDSQQLTNDASPDGRDLYRCEIGPVGGSLGCLELEDISAPLEGSGESSEVREVSPGMGEDGSIIYFVASGILDTDVNELGETAVAEGDNLYRWQEGQGVRFIAALSDRDSPDWGEALNDLLGHSARVTASSSSSGRYLSFMSERNLTGQESNDPATGEPVEQAFLYDAVEDHLTCISCNPSGVTDPGHQIVEDIDKSEGGVIFPDPLELWKGRWVGATLPEASENEPTVGLALYRPRAVLDSGRAYFNSFAPLATADSNENWDVYQYEPFDVGSCSPESASETVAVAEEGCVGLVSSGTDSMPSVFMDASASGDDVFFATFAGLSPLDTDGIVDVYDARVNGLAAVAPEPRSECSGEACQPGGPPPVASNPSSASFNGAGNLKPKPPNKHCRKGQKKVRKKGKVKCVPRSKHGRHGKSGGAR